MSKPGSTKNLNADWERVEADYRAGILSVREISRLNKCSHTAIQKRADELGWARNLEAKIRAKAGALVAKRAVASQVAKTTEVATIEANANLLAAVTLNQRTWTDRASGLITTMMAELERTMQAPELFAQVHAAIENGEDPDPKVLRDLASLVSSLPEREKVARGLIESLQRAVHLQRLVYGMDERQKPPEDVDSYESLLDRANARRSAAAAGEAA